MKNLVVVDTSLAIKWVLNEPDSDKALALLNQWNANGVVMIAPSLLSFEAANAFYKNFRKGKITLIQAQRAIEAVLAIGIVLEFPEKPTLHLKALELTERYKLPAAYDAHYLALAERENCELWTANMRFWNAIKHQVSCVHMVGDYEMTN